MDTTMVPMRELSEEEATAAKAATNYYIHEPHDRLKTQPYAETNEVDTLTVQQRPEYPESEFEVNHPSELFRDTVTLTPEHGPLAEILCDGTGSIDLSAQEFWELLCLWITLASKDCETARKQPEKHFAYEG